MSDLISRQQPVARDTNVLSNDTVSRQAAIDAMGSMLRRKFGIGGDLAEITLAGLPSAQPEIIRCKDCKYYQFADNRAFGFPVKRCEWTGFEDVDDNDFCSRGERKTDELD